MAAEDWIGGEEPHDHGPEPPGPVMHEEQVGVAVTRWECEDCGSEVLAHEVQSGPNPNDWPFWHWAEHMHMGADNMDVDVERWECGPLKKLELGVRGEVYFDAPKHEYWLGGHRLWSVTEVLRETGFLDPTKYREAARERGSEVHMALRMIDEGLATPEMYRGWKHEGYVRAWVAFRHEVDVSFDVIEKPIGWLSLMSAGTPDRVGMLMRERSVLDLKTGGAEPWHRLQLAGYQILLSPPDISSKTRPPDEADKVLGLMEMLRSRERYPRPWRVRLRDNGRYTLDDIQGEERLRGEDRLTFHAALEVLKWRASYARSRG